MKKVMSMVLSIIMIMSVISATVLTANAQVISGNCGADDTNVTFTLDTNTGILKISGKGEMKNGILEEREEYSVVINIPWQPTEDKNEETIKTVIINSGITNVGDYAFYACKKLTGITIPNGIMVIGTKSFYGCTNLPSIIIPDGVTSIGEKAFAWCDSLTTITIPSSVKNIGWSSFGACYNLKDVYYSGTESQWNEINIGTENDFLTDATIHYNSSIQETEKPISNPSQPNTYPDQSNEQVTVQTTVPVSLTAVTTKKPKATTVLKVKSGKKSFKLTWKKVNGVSGYQIKYSTSKKFTKKTTKYTYSKGNKKFSKTISKLKGGKKYYVKVRSYKIVNGKKVYSSWSKVKSVKTK